MTADTYGLAWTIAASAIAINVCLAVCIGRLTTEVTRLRYAVEAIETLLRRNK